MKNYKEFLHHIFEETEYLLKECQSLTFNTFFTNDTLKRAFVRSLEIIGEAVKQIPDEIKEAYSNIEWKNLAGLRDVLIHHYFGVDFNLVWDCIGPN
ncbi:MAG: DUF86 domain-containing protein [Brevinematales bacterium]|nr:DUF86 domain-containing protein [Brevinematales bacterium]